LGAAIDLPTELTAFLDRPTPQSLIIRGTPGTGKSLLALGILEAFPGPRIYVSSRVPRSRLKLDFPSLGRQAEAGQLSIVDLTAGGTDLRTASRSLESARELVEPEAATDRLRSLLLPPEVLEAWSRASPSAPTLIVLDSWDAIVERHVDITKNVGDALPSREELERVALAQMAQGPVLLVMVLEHADAGQLEYLADGVVAVIREIHEDRMERWLHIEKLRGTRIAHSSYPFSLEGGRFQCIAPLGLGPRSATPPIDRQPSPSPGQIWPGSSDYASFFGRLTVGKLTLFELDPEVPNSAVAMMVAPLLNQVVAGGGRVLHIPPPGMQPTEIWKLYQGQTSKEDFLRQVRLLCPLPGIEPEDLSSAILPLPSSNEGGYSPRVPEAARFLSENSDPRKPNLAVLSIAGMDAINGIVPNAYTPTTLPGLSLTYLHQSPLHGVYIGYSEAPLTRAVRPMVDGHVRLSARYGRVFVHGVLPRTPSLVLSDGDEETPYHLRLVV